MLFHSQPTEGKRSMYEFDTSLLLTILQESLASLADASPES